MKLIAAVSEKDGKWAIGNKGNLLFRIPDDLRKFKLETEGKVIIYGRKTLETFPNQKPLKHRINLIFSKNDQFNVDEEYNAYIVHDLKDLFSYLQYFNIDEVYLIGGQSIYEQYLYLCDTAYITMVKMNGEFEADAYMPNLDKDDKWVRTEISKPMTYEGLTYYYMTYVRKLTC